MGLFRGTPGGLKMSSNWNQEAEARFQAQIQAEGALAYHYACILSAILWPAGSILDWFASRAYFYELSVIRWATGGLFLLLYLFSRIRLVYKYPYGFTLFLVVLGSLSITLMCLQLGGYQSQYYAGINAIVIAIGLLAPYEAKRVLILVGASLLTYWIPISVSDGFQFYHLNHFVNNQFFLVLSAFLVAVAANRREDLKRGLFERHLKLEEANRRLQHYDRLRSDFFSNISHEFRTPLTLILASLERLRPLQAQGETRPIVSLIRSNALILLRHVNDLLDLSKLETGKMKASLRLIDLSEFVSRIASMFQIVADERKIRFKIEVPQQLMAAVDTEKFERILLNLLSNAFKFIGDGSYIRISLKEEPTNVILEVEDDGPGIPEGLREKVFERFYQADRGDSRAFEGTGLGLSIVREFVSLHHGTVTVTPPLGGGTIFRIVLPLIKSGDIDQNTVISDQAVVESIVTDHHSAQGGLDLAGGDLDVLIVEDHGQMRSFLLEEVSKHFSAVGASSAAEAFRVLEKRIPALILSDLMMPQMSGAEFFESLKNTEALKEVPLMFLTAKADDEIALKLLKLGAVDYLIKPFSPQELIAKIRNHLSIHRAKQNLQRELVSKQSDLELLTGEIIDQKQKLELAVQTSELSRDEALEAGNIKSKFLGFVSHELKNPMAAVRMTARTLLDGSDKLNEQSRKTLLVHLVKSADSLQSIVDSLLDYTKLRKGRLMPNLSEVHVNELMEGVVADLKPFATSKGLDLHVSSFGNLKIRSDRELLTRVLSNLVSNAIKYTSVGGIQISAEENEQGVEMVVADTGVGFDSTSISQIFEEFERLRGPQSFVPGIGLGLALVKMLVESLQGSISVTSVPNKGSRFAVQLPRTIERVKGFE